MQPYQVGGSDTSKTEEHFECRRTTLRDLVRVTTSRHCFMALALAQGADTRHEHSCLPYFLEAQLRRNNGSSFSVFSSLFMFRGAQAFCSHFFRVFLSSQFVFFNISILFLLCSLFYVFLFGNLIPFLSGNLIPFFCLLTFPKKSPCVISSDVYSISFVFVFTLSLGSVHAYDGCADL